MLNVAVVGVGFIGEEHVEAIRRTNLGLSLIHIYTTRLRRKPCHLYRRSSNPLL